MDRFNPQSAIAPKVLATDLDGTLIPLPDEPRNVSDLARLSDHFSGNAEQTLVFATGRHFESVLEAMDDYKLPIPDWIICDVGSAIYQKTAHGFEVFEKYTDHLGEVSSGMPRTKVEPLLEGIDGLALQPPEHQQRFKISYQSSAQSVLKLVDEVNRVLQTAKLPYQCMGSLDPFQNCGLLDVMPAGVSKAYALMWLSTHADFQPDEVVYSGDSGNDFAALVCGFRAIIVANGSEGLAEKVTASLQDRNLADRLYCAKGCATSGVLEGCRHFGLI